MRRHLGVERVERTSPQATNVARHEASRPAYPREGVAGLGRRMYVLGEGSPKGLPEPRAPSMGRYVVAWGLQRSSRWFPRRAWVSPGRLSKTGGDGLRVDSKSSVMARTSGVHMESRTQMDHATRQRT